LDVYETELATSLRPRLEVEAGGSLHRLVQHCCAFFVTATHRVHKGAPGLRQRRHEQGAVVGEP
jgi:hypothetical protein